MSKDKIEVSIKDIPQTINVLKQMEREIKFERKSKDLFIDDLYKVCEMSLKQTQEIERLNNIIKEIREYIKDNAYWAEETEDGDFVSGKLLHDDDITYIEELLNKGEKND